jgi:regulator of PEP synthase PpsR (kinase-PPPase family)
MITILTVSDATGTTAEGVVRAALVQFDTSKVKIIRIGEVRTIEAIRHIVKKAAKIHAFIVHTFVSDELRHAMLTEGRSKNVVTIDIMGPVLARLSELLEIKPKQKPGGFQPFDTGYMERIEAIDYSVRHDDGRNVHDLAKADIVLVGVSRTSKTPLSIYLAYRGWRVANIPIVLGVEPPPNLFELPKHRVVGLIIQPERLVELRQVRVKSMGTKNEGYADLEHIKQEVAYAYRLFERRRDWPLVDVTTKPIEETATEVVSLIGFYKKELSDIGI